MFHYDYKYLIENQIDNKSFEQGLDESRLPHFTEDEMIEIQDSADFLGLNFYTTSLVYPTPKNEIDPGILSWDTDSDVSTFQDSKWLEQ